MTKENSNSPSFNIPIATYRAINQNAADTPKTGISTSDVSAILEETTDKLNNAKAILEVLTDLKLAMEIRTAMLLSPKDFMQPDFKLKLVGRRFFGNEKATALLSTIEQHFRSKTTIEKDMAKFVDEALFMYGAHIWLMVPPNALDEFIQSSAFSVESINTLYEKSQSLKSHIRDDIVSTELSNLGIESITWDVNQLRVGRAAHEMKTGQLFPVSMESYGYSPITSNGEKQVMRHLSLPSDFKTKGNPIVFDVAMDCCLPVKDPGDNERHLFYILQVDKSGYMASRAKEADYFGELGRKLKAAVSSKSGTEYEALKKIGFDATKKTPNIDNILEVYKSALSSKIESAIRTSADGVNFTISHHDSFYRTMLASCLKKQETRLLLVPSYMVHYMAFDYDSSGNGVSLLEKTQLYSSLRAVLMFSDLIRQVNNSIPKSTLQVTLDEAERDGVGVVRKLVAEYGRLTDRKIPLGVYSPSTMLDELRKSGIRVQVDGGNRLPGTKLDVVDEQRQIARVESDLTEQLKRQQYAGLSVPPEAVDQSLQGDFAIDRVTNNQLFVKRSMIDQKRFIISLKERITKYIYLSGELYTSISDAVGEGKVDDFIEDLTPHLPTADTVRLEQQIEAYNRYSDFIDTVMQHHISDAALRGLVETSPTADALEELRATIGNHFKREYLRNENILPELHAMFEEDDEVDGISSQLEEYHERLFKSIGKIIKGLMESDSELAKKLEPEQKEEGSTGTSPSDTESSAVTWPFGGNTATEEPPESEEDLPEPDAEGGEEDI